MCNYYSRWLLEVFEKLPFLSFELHAAFYCKYAMFYFPRKCSHSVFYIPVTYYSSDKIILQLFVKLLVHFMNCCKEPKYIQNV